MADLSRRSFFSKVGQAAIFVAATPAIVRVASLDFLPKPLPSLRLLGCDWKTEKFFGLDVGIEADCTAITTYAYDKATRNIYPTLAMFTREVVAQWKHSNAFLDQLGAQYEETFNPTGVGSTLRIKLPKDYEVRETHKLT